MKKTQKKILGIFGLVVVVATTIFAAALPGPSASATTQSVTDTITVRVLDEIPSVSILNPESGEVVSSLDTPITIDYTNTKHYTVVVTYIDEDGNEYPTTIIEQQTEDEFGTLSYPFREVGEQYGYGHYIITVTGEGLDGSAVEDSISFEYAATTASATVDEDNGIVNIDLEYGDADDEGLSDDEKVSKVEINVYDENGNLVDGLSPIIVNAPTRHVEISFDEYGLPSGNYTIAVQPYNATGQKLYRLITFMIRYDELLVPSTADTGGLFKGVNISKADYLITGVIAFGIVGVAGIVFICKRSRSTNKRRK